jgi:hypothetical protein
MKTAAKSLIVLVLITLLINSNLKAQQFAVDFYEQTFNFTADETLNIKFDGNLNKGAVLSFYNEISKSNHQSLINSLLKYKDDYKLNDWLYYQLIRKTAQQLSPKNINYNRYTLYKWFLMVKSGYDAKLAIGNNQLIFYVFNDEDISDIPSFTVENKKYMCLNYHDFGKLFNRENVYIPVKISIPEAKQSFSYKVTRLPDFKPENYSEKQIEFSYKQKPYHFKIKVSDEIESIFANYPVVDFETYFNIPLSRETYQSFIPKLKENLKKMNTKNGVDYLMRFTRYAFLYEDDEANFGKEKRLSPEQTLLTKASDCDDRAALFFYLVKEIYNLPMIAILYPTHLTMAVEFEKPVGDVVHYQGKSYSVCEPTPQKQKLKIGQLSTEFKNTPYQIVYAYAPSPLK